MSQPVILSNCDREPIHVSGSVQLHGILLDVDPATRRIFQAEGPVERLLGIRDWVWASLSEVIGLEFAERI